MQTPRFVPVDPDRHRSKRLRALTGFDFAAKLQVAHLTAHEFPRAAAVYPIVFAPDAASQTLRPLALLGLEEGENLFVASGGQWQAGYVPAVIRRHPFVLAQSSTEGQYTVCVDEGSTLLSDEEGEALFDEQGQPTPLIENVKRYLGELQQMDAVTQAFSQDITRLELLTPIQLQLRLGGAVRDFTGCHIVNEEKLNQLPEEAFAELRRKGYLPALYAQLISLGQFDRLLSLKSAQASPGGIAGAEPANKLAA